MRRPIDKTDRTVINKIVPKGLRSRQPGAVETEFARGSVQAASITPAFEAFMTIVTKKRTTRGRDMQRPLPPAFARAVIAAVNPDSYQKT
jgi:hypothetical protein